jgi:hypothetical protein
MDGVDDMGDAAGPTRESVEMEALEWVSFLSHHLLLAPIECMPATKAQVSH